MSRQPEAPTKRGNYVFQVDGKAVEPTLSKLGSYWSVKNGEDTMTTMWNSSATAGDISVTINFQGGTGHYSNLIHLEPFASFNLDIALLIANKMPDKDGNAIPLVISEGSIIFANAKGRTLPISLNVSLGIFNAATATSDFYCLDCDGYIRAEVTSSQLDLLLSTSYAMTVRVGSLAGYFYDVQAFCTNDPGGLPAGEYINGSQQIDVAAGGRNFPSLRTNVINMRSDDVTLTCTQNCH